MKLLTLFTLITLLSWQIQAQPQKYYPLQPLKNANYHAGCFLNPDDSTYANLYTYQNEIEGDFAQFNVEGKDVYLKVLPSENGWEVYQNDDITIRARANKGKHQRKSCMYYHRYRLIINYKEYQYQYKLKGFCGC